MDDEILTKVAVISLACIAGLLLISAGLLIVGYNV